jgi:unsaturated rhamnogalacturonyl hydrolase
MTDIQETVAKIAEQTLSLAFDGREPKVPNHTFEARRWQQWDWSMGVAFYGLWKAYDIDHDDAYVARMKEWIDARIDRGIQTICVNTNALLTTVLRLHQRYSEERYEKICRVYDDYLLETAPRVPCGALAHTTLGSQYSGQVWADTLFMSILYATQRSLVLNDRGYLYEAIRQLILHVEKLFDAHTGLFYHGWNDVEQCALGGRWGRANAWVIVSVVEILELVPFDFPEKQDLLNRLHHQVAALQELQDMEGCWRTVLDHPETYAETSATAGVAYGVLKGIRLGLVAEPYAPMAQRGIKWLLRTMDDDGNVLHGSSGTPIKQNVGEYAHIPYAITPFTQGLALMALCEYELQSGQGARDERLGAGCSIS